MTDGRGLGQGQPIGGHQPTYQTTVQVSGWELGQGYISGTHQLTYQATVQLLLLTHRFRGIFRRLGQRDRWAGYVEGYEDATNMPYGYLLVDQKPDQDEQYRLRTNAFPGEMQHVYVRK